MRRTRKAVHRKRAALQGPRGPLCLETPKSSFSCAIAVRRALLLEKNLLLRGLDGSSIPNSQHESGDSTPLLPTAAVPVRCFARAATTTEIEKSKYQSGNYWHATPPLDGRSYAGRRAHHNSDVRAISKTFENKKSLRCESASAENMRVFVRRLKVEPLLWVSMRQKLGGARGA